MEHTTDGSGDDRARPRASEAPPEGANAIEDLLRGAAHPEQLAVPELRALQRSAGNQAVLKLLRQVAPPVGAQTDAAAAERPTQRSAALSLVADSAQPGPAGMRQGEFLTAVESAVCAVAERELAGTVYTSAGCPWIEHWISYYRTVSLGELQTAIGRYAPAADAAPTLADVIDAISARVSAGIATWRTTRKLPDIAGPQGSVTGGPPVAPSPVAASPETRQVMRMAVAETPEALVSELGPGRPISTGLAARMGAALGADVSSVRFHTDDAAGRTTARAGATALTVGSHVAFARGTFEPGTPVGDALIAHELAHVTQHVEGAPVASDAAAERDALDASMAAVAGLHGHGHGMRRRRAVRSGLALRRCGSTTTREGVFGQAPQLERTGFDRRGNVAGVAPTLDTKGTLTTFTFDGDGDQGKELSAELSYGERWPSGAAKRVGFALSQISSGRRLTADFDLPDRPLGDAPDPVMADVTDGDRPTDIFLVEWGRQRLWVQPPQRSPAATTYVVQLVSGHENGVRGTITRTVTYTFPAERDALNSVFTTEDPAADPAKMDSPAPTGFVKVGDIWSLDVTAGAYGDRFRLTFRPPGDDPKAVTMGIAVLAKGKPLAGHAVSVPVNGALRPRILSSDPVRLALDLDGDSRADVTLFDHLEADANDPRSDRVHELTIEDAKGQKRRLSYPVSSAEITAGPGKGEASEFRAASDTHAVTALEKQEQLGTFNEKKGQLTAELVWVAQGLADLRVQARDRGLISTELYDAWSKAESAFLALGAYAGETPPKDLVDEVAVVGPAFYDELAKATAGDQHTTRDPTGSHGSRIKTNPYTGRTEYYREDEGGRRHDDRVEDPRVALVEAIKGGRFGAALALHGRLVYGLDQWVAHLNRTSKATTAPTGETIDSTKLAAAGDYLNKLRWALESIADKNPTRVAAVLHVEEDFTDTGDVADVPLSLYYWQEGGDWYLKDLTTPDDQPHWSRAVKPGETEPPKELFDKLDDNAHFPKGVVHWLLPSGTGGQVRTTGPSKLGKVARWVGLIAAAVGLGLVTFGAGTVEVLGSYALAAGALIGAADAAYDFYDRAKHGTLTPGSVMLDLASIVSAVSGMGALRFGRILGGVRKAASAGVALEATGAVRTATTWYVRARAINAVADTVTLAVMSDDLVTQIQRIHESHAKPGEKERAYALLFTQFAFTAGLTALSVKSGIPEMYAGQDIEIVRLGNIDYAIPRGESAVGRQINESSAKLGGAPDVAAQEAHLKLINKIGGAAGKNLAAVEAMRLNPRTTGDIQVDAAGKVSVNGQPAGDLASLVEQVQRANAAAAAHGVPRYQLSVGPGPKAGTSRVQVVAEPAPTAKLGSLEAARLYTNVSQARAANIAAATTSLHAADPQSHIDIRADGRLRINNQIDLDVAMLDEISRTRPADVATLEQGTRELDAAGGSLDALRKSNPALADALAKLHGTGTYRLRFDYNKTEGLKWAQGLSLSDDLRAQLGILLGEADEDSLARFFDLANESPAVRGKFGARANNAFAQYALEQHPANLTDFVNHYQYARAELTIRRHAGGITDEDLVKSFETDTTRAGVGKTEASARAANAKAYTSGGRTIKAGDTAETVTALRQDPQSLGMSDPNTLTYHVHKHYPDLPANEKVGAPGAPTTEAEAYMVSARKTLMTTQPGESLPAGDPKKFRGRPTQDGLGEVYTFERPKPGAKSPSRLLVLVRFDGVVTMLTYMP